MTAWTNDIVRILTASYTDLANATKATQMNRYMKGVAPFFGIAAPQVKTAVKSALAEVGIQPDAIDLQETVTALFALDQREFHYSSIEIVAKFWTVVPEQDLVPFAERMITTKSWWDTVDAVGTALVTPMNKKHDKLEDMRRWLASDNMWLVRAAIQHMRGRKNETDIARVIEFCDARSDDKEFFIAKAVGWALRDLCRFGGKGAVREFLERHPTLPAVARREAQRGLAR